jgi:hypothetical protein
MLGLLIVAAGAVNAVIGLAAVGGGFGWFGRIPGDARIERGGVRLHAPLASMLLLSLLPTLLLSLIRRFL